MSIDKKLEKNGEFVCGGFRSIKFGEHDWGVNNNNTQEQITEGIIEKVNKAKIPEKEKKTLFATRVKNDALAKSN